jgi:citrate synthase
MEGRNSTQKEPVMTKPNGAKGGGLEGIVVADTALSEVDGECGRLIIHGYQLEQLAPRAGVEDVAALLWNGRLPDQVEKGAMRAALGDGRVRAFERLGSLGNALSLPDAMDSLRACLAHLPSSDRSEGPDLVGATAVFAAAAARCSAGLAPIPPDPSLTHASDYLRMLLGPRASEAASRALDTYLVTVADHGMNASTFAARVVASTGSDAVSAVVAGVGALKGPLHGGAPGPVLDMLDAIASPDRAPSWLKSELAAGRRIMGMGHRIYRVRDPRAAVLEQALLRLDAEGVATDRLALARSVEHAAEELLARRHPDRPLRANVEFYTAVLLEAIGIPRRAFAATFAVGRVVGWYAHIDEQRRTGRLIRPASRYVGPSPTDAP